MMGTEIGGFGVRRRAFVTGWGLTCMVRCGWDEGREWVRNAKVSVLQKVYIRGK